MKIFVTGQHIQKGKRGTLRSCPIARALKDAGFTHVEVGSDGVRVDGIDLDPPFPPKVRRFVNQFDNGDVVEPFDFPLTGFTPYPTCEE